MSTKCQSYNSSPGAESRKDKKLSGMITKQNCRDELCKRELKMEEKRKINWEWITEKRILRMQLI